MPRQVQRPIEPVKRYALTKREAAASLGISVDTFERRVQPFLKVIICGQLVLIPPAELDKWIVTNARSMQVSRSEHLYDMGATNRHLSRAR